MGIYKWLRAGMNGEYSDIEIQSWVKQKNKRENTVEFSSISNNLVKLNFLCKNELSVIIYTSIS